MDSLRFFFLLTLLILTLGSPTVARRSSAPFLVRQSNCAQSDNMCMVWEMLRIHNDYRVSAGHPRQKLNYRLHRLAMRWARSSLPRAFEHTTRQYMRSNRIYAENIAGGPLVISRRRGIPGQLMYQWWTSSGHKKNMLRSLDSVGIGIAVVGDWYYGVQMFGPLLSGDDDPRRWGMGSRPSSTRSPQATTAPTKKPTATTPPSNKPLVFPTRRPRPTVDPTRRPTRRTRPTPVPTKAPRPAVRPTKRPQPAQAPSKSTNSVPQKPGSVQTRFRRRRVYVCFSRYRFCLKMSLRTARRIRRALQRSGRSSEVFLRRSRY